MLIEFEKLNLATFEACRFGIEKHRCVVDKIVVGYTLHDEFKEFLAGPYGPGGSLVEEITIKPNKIKVVFSEYEEPTYKLAPNEL